jgi:hypothetical protein
MKEEKIGYLTEGIFCGTTLPENFNLKSMLLFNDRIVMPTTFDKRLDYYSYIDYLSKNNDEIKQEISKRFILNKFYFNDMAPIVWLIQIDKAFHNIIADRLLRQNIKWKNFLRKWHASSFNEDCSEDECFSHVVSETKRLFISAVIAHQRNSSVICTGPQSDIAHLPIFGAIDEYLYENFESPPYPKEALKKKDQFLKDIKQFTRKNKNGFLKNAGEIAFPEVVYKELPIIRKLSLDQIIKLKASNKLRSLYIWLEDRAKQKKFNLSRASSSDLADFMQDSLWEIVMKVDPDIPSETVKFALSNIPGLPVNPIGLYFGALDIANKKSLKEDFRGLFIISNIYKLMN